MTYQLNSARSWTTDRLLKDVQFSHLKSDVEGSVIGGNFTLITWHELSLLNEYKHSGNLKHTSLSVCS